MHPAAVPQPPGNRDTQGESALRRAAPGDRAASRGRLAPAARWAYNARMTHDADSRRKAVSAGRPHGPAAAIIVRG